MENTVVENTNKCNSSTLKKGQYLSEIQFYQVRETDSYRIELRNERGFEFGAARKIVAEGMYSADQFKETKKVSRTEMAEILTSAYGAVFTVSFQKRVTAKDMKETVANFNKGNFKSKKEMEKEITSSFKGTERILIGYLVKPEPIFGRCMCIDLEKDKGDNPKWDARLVLVTHANLNWLIYKNVKYVIK